MTKRLPEPELRGPLLVASLVAIFYAGCGIARYLTYTNQTFDLAFYARMAWGMVRGDLWDPILGAHVLGLHVSPVLAPIGVLGAAIGTPIALYLAQGVATALAVIPLARLGHRRFGAIGAYAGALALVLHPNLGHVLAFEAHPGTLAVLPLAYLAYAVAMNEPRTLITAAIGVLACREDLALVVICASIVSAREQTMRRSSAIVAAIALSWLLVFVLVLHPIFKPTHGSMEAHFGPWGRSVPEVLRTIASDPARLAHHLLAPKRLSYLPRVLAPLALFPIFAPRLLFVAAPILGVALVSFFSTTTRIDSHYLTPALPILVVAAIEGGRWLVDRLAAVRGTDVGTRSRAAIATALFVASVLGTVYSGLFSLGFPRPLFARPPVPRRELDALARRVPSAASVEAPDALLPHFAERRVVHRTAEYPHDDDAIILDLAHRARFRHSEDLIRTTEEPRVRALLARADYAFVTEAGPYALFVRDHGDAAKRIDRVRIDRVRVLGRAAPAVPPAAPIAHCLSIAEARREGATIVLTLVARSACAPDLAIRLGSTANPSRVDLLFDGLVSPSHLREGDVVRSIHDDPDASANALYVGALRSSGARPDPDDPVAIPIPIR